MGLGFRVEEKTYPFLSYEVGSSGWKDRLTSLHEETAGADHFMDRASRDHVIRELKKYLDISSPLILEVGCSSGFMLRQIRKELPQVLLIGADYVAGPLSRLAAKEPMIPLLQFDLTRCPLPSSTLDVVILLNVLEHIPDDQAALAQAARILKPRGLMIIEVPAGVQLYDVYDRFLMHHRRYSGPELKKMAESMDLEILTYSHLGFLLYPGFWWVKRRNRRWMAQDEEFHRRIVEQNIAQTKENRWLQTIMKIELLLGKWISYPRGIRCWLTCRKR